MTAIDRALRAWQRARAAFLASDAEHARAWGGLLWLRLDRAAHRLYAARLAAGAQPAPIRPGRRSRRLSVGPTGPRP